MSGDNPHPDQRAEAIPRFLNGKRSFNSLLKQLNNDQGFYPGVDPNKDTTGWC